VVVALERLRVIVDRRLSGTRDLELVVPAAIQLDRPEAPDGVDRLLVDRPIAHPLAGSVLHLEDAQRPAVDAGVVGKDERSALDRHLARSLGDDGGRFRRSADQELVHVREGLGRRGHVRVGLPREVDVLGTSDRAGLVALAPDGQRRNAARRSVAGAAVEVDVPAHRGRPLGGGEVAVHHRGPARMREDVHLLRAGGLLDARDEAVEVGDRDVVGADGGVVLVGEDPVLWEPVAGQAHRVRLELLR
jgi:hypothetical protein